MTTPPRTGGPNSPDPNRTPAWATAAPAPDPAQQQWQPPARPQYPDVEQRVHDRDAARRRIGGVTAAVAVAALVGTGLAVGAATAVDSTTTASTSSTGTTSSGSSSTGSGSVSSSGQSAVASTHGS